MRPISTILVLLLTTLFVGCGTSRPDPSAQIRLTSPAERLVYQRGLDGTALLPVAGITTGLRGPLEARLVSLPPSNADSPWQALGAISSDGQFSTHLRAPAGWYRLEVRAKGQRPQSYATVEHVGIGEVFIVVGHSVAHGGTTNLPGATDDRVNTIAWSANSEEQRREYERTADPRFLPPLVGTHFGDQVVPAPFGHGTYFWADFAERVVRAQGVPVLMLNAAFGGTSLEHWAKSARGEQFEHSFVKAAIGMPYVNLHHALHTYASVTGVRAILADQGQNDWPENDAGKVFANYRAWVDKARADLGFPTLAIVVNRASPPGNRPVIRRVQEQMIREVPHCYAGPDYDTLNPSDRYDAVHFAASGLSHAAQLWAEALSPDFFQRAIPFQPASR